MSSLVSDVEVYSIDELFVRVPGRSGSGSLAGGDLVRAICERVWRWTGLPTAAGLGATKTLAKVAQREAKNRGVQVLDLTTWPAVEVQELLASTPTVDLWGIGVKLARRLAAVGVRSALDLARVDPMMLRRIGSVVLERTGRELAGTPCIPLGGEPPRRRQIQHTRMLGATVSSRQEMRAVLTTYAQRATTRLRATGLVAGALTVSMSTSPFRANAVHHSWTTGLAPATAEPLDIIRAAHRALPAMREGLSYSRAGIMLTDLSPADHLSALPLETPAPGSGATHDPAIGAAVDAVTRRFGAGTLGYGTAGLRQEPRWAMRRGLLSPEATTRWDQMLTASST